MSQARRIGLEFRKIMPLRLCVVLMGLLFSAGCEWQKETILYLRDEVCKPGETIKLTAQLEENDWHYENVSGKPISFWRVTPEGRYESLGGDVTDREGHASASFRVPGAGEYLIECQFAGASRFKPVSYQAGIFCKTPFRFGIILDIDKTLAATTTKDVFAGRFRFAPPLDSHTVRVVNTLAKEYELFIVTNRPRTQAGVVMEWLARNGFPRVPTFFYDPWVEAIRPAKSKRKIVQELKREYPLIAVGIGDRESDLANYMSNGILAIGIGRTERGAFCVRTWRDVEALLLGQPDPQLVPPQLLVGPEKEERKFWPTHKETGWGLEYALKAGDFHTLPPAPWADQLKKILQLVAAP